jgi:ribosomal protein S18 acetylase RimI-like enzyme
MTKVPESSITIRPASPDDVSGIARVHVDSWRTTYRGIVPDSVLDSLDYDSRADMWGRAIASPTGTQRLHVAESASGEIVGFVAAGPERSSEHPPFTAEIYAVYVDESWQGRRLGRKLIEAGVRSLLEQGHQAMIIWALTENPACGFYRRLGGVPIATQMITIGRKSLEETAFGWENIAVLLDSG